MNLITPAQLEALTGLSVANQREWQKADFWRGHYTLTQGGQRRFKPMDVAYVALIQALAKSGLRLAVCAELMEFAAPFVIAKLRGEPPNCEGYAVIPEMSEFAVFAFHEDHATDQAYKVSWPLGDTGYRGIYLKDLNQSVIYSKCGGHHFFVNDLVASLPRAVLDLLPAWREMP